MALAGADTEIVSVDSMQVYRGMDIGTAKPMAAESAHVRHHMIDLVDPAEPFSVAEFQRRGRDALATIPGRALLVGGSGLHFRAIIDPLEFPPTDGDVRASLEQLADAELRARLLGADPGSAELVDLDNRRRVIRALEIIELVGETPTQRSTGKAAQDVAEYRASQPVAIVGVDPGPALDPRIVERTDAMLGAGWLGEAAALWHDMGPTASSALGYRELAAVAAGTSTIDEARDRIISDTRRLAKRQRTFFRRDPRIRWLPWKAELGERAADAAAALEEALWSS
jgi:tRNA dimethylallyltransferase